MKNFSLAVGFVLELIAFFGFSSIAFLIPTDRVFQFVIFAVLLIFILTFWSIFMAPKAIKKFKVVPYYTSKVVIYGLAALVITQKENLSSGLLFLVVCVIDEIFLFNHNIS